MPDLDFEVGDELYLHDKRYHDYFNFKCRRLRKSGESGHEAMARESGESIDDVKLMAEGKKTPSLNVYRKLGGKYTEMRVVVQETRIVPGFKFIDDSLPVLELF